jgi:hypothetical protein
LTTFIDHRLTENSRFETCDFKSKNFRFVGRDRDVQTINNVSNSPKRCSTTSARNEPCIALVSRRKNQKHWAEVAEVYSIAINLEPRIHFSKSLLPAKQNF